MKFIDVHCHLDGGHYGNIDELLARVKAAGVQKVITVGVDVKTSLFCRELSEMYPEVYFAAGFHPTELKEYSEDAVEEIKKIAAHNKCVAIGEIGLDYHYPDTDKRLQKRAFLRQIELADEVGLPVQIHSRDCAEDMLALIKDNVSLLKNGVLLHCYSHSVEIAKELEKLGVYFSFGGTSTYSGSKKARRTISALGEDRLLTETDSPYLPPKSRLGQFPNTPESIPEIVQNIADIRGVSLKTAADEIWSNAHTLFTKLG